LLATVQKDAKHPDLLHVCELLLDGLFLLLLGEVLEKVW